jgi:hypothetical protein
MAPPRVGPPLPGTAETEIDGHVWIYAPGADEVLQLSETATAIWHLLDGTRTEADIVSNLAEQYGTPPEEICGDVRAALRSLVAAGAIAGPDAEQSETRPD